MVVLTPEKIKLAIEDLHRRKPGKILAAMEIYLAIAQAQYNEDTKEVKSGNRGENSDPEKQGNQKPG